MGRGGRARLAETCGTCDESPSSNLGRGKPGQAIRSDCTHPQDDDTVWLDVSTHVTQNESACVRSGSWRGRDRPFGEEGSEVPMLTTSRKN